VKSHTNAPTTSNSIATDAIKTCVKNAEVIHVQVENRWTLVCVVRIAAMKGAAWIVER